MPLIWRGGSATIGSGMKPRLLTFLFAACAVWFSATAARAQSPAQQGIYLVFPFNNAGASPRLDWLGEGLEELTIQRLSAAGHQVFSHAGRVAELERYGLPPGARFSRATMLRVAEDLDADFVVFGSFRSDGKNLTVESRILRVSPAALLPAVRESGSLDGLMDLHARLAWRLLSSMDSAYPLSMNEFAKRQRPLRLDAFEHYIRGLLAGEDELRIREMREAARLEPDWAAPDFALGQAYFARRDCASAQTWLAKIPKSADSFVESEFLSGVCKLLQGQADRAEETFAALQARLKNNAEAGGDIPELLNNLAIARARQGKSAQEELKAAAELDPDEDDYPFNQGLLAMRSNDFAEAAKYFREAVERETDNPEDRAFLILALEKAGRKDEAEQERVVAAEALGPDALRSITPDAAAKIERIKTELDMTAARFDVQAPESASAAPSAARARDTAATHMRRGRSEFVAGQLDSAEKEFRAALASSGNAAAAHRGLADVARRRDKPEDAIKELQASLASRDSAVVRTLLAKIYLEQKKTDLARAELERALKLAPNYAEAKQLLERVANGKPGGGAR